MAATATPAAPADPVADRAAILAMQGEYTVGFAFDETVLLAPGYTRAEPQRSGGDEIVVVVEDTPTRVVLQHLLLDVKSGHVTKHWRQDWEYEAPRRWEFTSDQTWRQRDLPADQVAGTWTQCVYEVSDAPRYCGTGRWTHANGISTWTSDPGFRPLPRREHTRRSDYNAMGAVNRHTIVPGGWTHEQDNTKAIRDADGNVTGAIARETGFNDYRRTDAIDFAPAYAYWAATRDYWARVRARWAQRLADPAGVHLKTKVDGMALIIPLFQQAQTVQDGGSVSDAEIDAVFAEWVAPAAR
ncbi:hypothetical protein LDO26_04655 [Luteimonas sp. BDR2-5]|uniref:DUF6607 family protein n=1 Tax=Proluteimonas luteida TaxID=2878685 RepID=UPI001E2C1099|nr:DUF6607 family protein [Luteimonas sp. BDR2-5]MCD9027504.1 hypothetical protein [Luteimonas sp. BDR2-5]